MKSLYIIFGVLVCGIIITILILNNPTLFWEAPNAENTVLESSKSKNTVWEVPVAAEVAMITKTLENNYITECLEFYVSQTEGNKYLIACSGNGSTWTYYLFNMETEQLQLLEKVQSTRLTAPDLVY